MHNSAVCENKSKEGKAKSEVSDSNIKNVTGETSTNCSSNLASISLQTAEIVLENHFNKKEVRVKALLDHGSQHSYLSQTIKSILDIDPIAKENISISTFRNWNSKQSTLEKVCFNLKNESEQHSVPPPSGSGVWGVGWGGVIFVIREGRGEGGTALS